MTACTNIPSKPGVELYNSGAYEASFSALSPIADRGGATAQYYVARLALEKKIDNPLTNIPLVYYLISAAESGHSQALGMLLFLSLTEDQRQRFSVTEQEKTEFLKILAELSSNISTTQQLRDFTVNKHLIRAILAFQFNHPINVLTQAEIIRLYTSHKKDTIVATFTISPHIFSEIDIALTRLQDKHAMTRMGKRYWVGYEVKKDKEKAISLFKRAAKYESAPRTCIYTPAIGDAKYGTTNCYDSALPPRPGVREAQDALCNIYKQKKDIYPKLRAYCVDG